MDTKPRQLKGQPIGGQYAPGCRPASAIDLAPAVAGPAQATIDTWADGRMRQVLDRVIDSHTSATKGWCEAGRDRPCTGATCDIAHAVTHLPTRARGTMRAWMESHDGDRVHTVQVTAAGTAWAPSGRTVRSGGATSMFFERSDGSTSGRRYTGMRVVASDEDTLVVASDHVLILYVAEGSADRAARSSDQPTSRR